MIGAVVLNATKSFLKIAGKPDNIIEEHQILT
jgi:hypothetical protein